MIPSTNFLKAYFASFTEDPVAEIHIDDDKKERGFGRAQKAVDDGDFSNVIPACIEEIESNGEHKRAAMLLRGTMNLVAGALDEAINDFNAIIDDPEAPTQFKVNALIKRASLHVQNEMHPQCFEDFAAAEKLDSSNADVVSNCHTFIAKSKQVNIEHVSWLYFDFIFVLSSPIVSSTGSSLCFAR